MVATSSAASILVYKALVLESNGALNPTRSCVPQNGGCVVSTFEGSDEFKLDSLMTSVNKAELFHFQRRCWKRSKSLQTS